MILMVPMGIGGWRTEPGPIFFHHFTHFQPRWGEVLPLGQPPSIGCLKWCPWVFCPTVPEEDESRIIGGRPCSIQERPFQVAIIKRGQILCGGSLIASQWVLTAAHCRQPQR